MIELRNVTTGKIATILEDGELELCYRFLKHECPDGEYTIRGPQEWDMMRVYRYNGVCYPAQPGQSLEECMDVFS